MTADLLQRTADTIAAGARAGRRHGRAARRDRAGGRLDADAAGAARCSSELTGQRALHRACRRYTSVAQGAAIHAAILEAKYRGERASMADKVRKMLAAVKQENVNSHGLGIVATQPQDRQDRQPRDDPPQHAGCRSRSRRRSAPARRTSSA